MRFLTLLILLFALFVACQPSGLLEHEQGIIAEIQKVAEQKKYEQQYIQIRDGERMFEQVQWTKVEPLDSLEGFHHLEIYNVYKEGNGKTEYYVSEFRFFLNDSSRQKIIDYQAIVEPDTTYTLLGVENNFKFAQAYNYKINGKAYHVYKLFGYAHSYDKDPVHYKYWSPDFGTLMLYSGQNDTFELETFQGKSEPVKALLKRIKEEMARKRM